MTSGEKIYHTLTADPAVSAIVGNRVYYLVIPQGHDFPCISFQKVSGPRENELAGPGELSHCRMQVDCWAKSYAQARELAKAATVSLGSGGFLPVGDRDDFEDEVRLHRVILEFTIWNKEE